MSQTIPEATMQPLAAPDTLRMGQAYPESVNMPFRVEDVSVKCEDASVKCGDDASNGEFCEAPMRENAGGVGELAHHRAAQEGNGLEERPGAEVGYNLGIAEGFQQPEGLACNNPTTREALASLIPDFAEPGILKGLSSSASTQMQMQEAVDWNSHSEHTHRDAVRMRSAGKRRRLAKRRSGSPTDDTDYDPGVKAPRPRKALSGSVAKMKSPGRTRLTLAGTASTIGDVDPGWTLPYGSVVLVAKALTKSDCLGRVILPRVAVETNMSFLTSFRAYTLAVRDLNDRPWEFVVKSWANGSEQRRVYVLEQAALFLRTNQLHEGDIIGICCDEEGNLQVAANTPALTEAVARPNYGHTFVKPVPKPIPGKNIPLATSHLGRCTRAPFCEKVPSHSGFCSGPRDRRRDAMESSAASGRSRPSADSLDDPKPVVSYPLTPEDVAAGQAGLPTLDLHCSQIWADESITVKDESSHFWTLSLAAVGPAGTLLLGRLEGFFQQEGVREGDCIVVSPQIDGSMLLQVDQGQNARKRKLASAHESTLLPVKCGELVGRFDLHQGLIMCYAGGVMETVTLQDFQRLAGYSDAEDWTETILVSEGTQTLCLKAWLDQQAVAPRSSSGRHKQRTAPRDSTNSFHSDFSTQPAPARRQRSRTVAQKPPRRSSSSYRGSSSRFSSGAFESEDSIAAEILVSLASEDFSSSASEPFMRSLPEHREEEVRSAAAQAAEEAEREARLAANSVCMV